MANWGLPGDYDEWEALGAEGWSWKSVEPYFRKVERDLDYPGEKLPSVTSGELEWYLLDTVAPQVP